MLRCFCGKEFEKRFDDFKNGQKQCPDCGRRIKNSLSYEDIKSYINNTSGNGCKLISTKEEFQNIRGVYNSQKKIKILCFCGQEFISSYSEFKRKNIQSRMCPFCTNWKKWTYNKVRQYIEIESNSKCKLLSKEYINYSTELCIQCSCGNIFYTSLANFNKKINPKRQCNDCGHKQKTHWQFLQEVYDLAGNEYEVLSEYIHNKNKILIKHMICNNIYEVIPDSFLRGRRCPYCAGKMKKTQDQFKSDVFNLYGNEYIVLGKYINNHTKVLIKHNISECNYEWEVQPSNFLQGTKCPVCALLNMSGINSPHWNNNITDEERIKIRSFNSSEYYKWRKQVYEKDNYTCQVCGDDKGGNLNAHHLDGYNWCKEKRFDVNNGITLCEICHNDFHHIYGYGGNTKEQFEQFIYNEMILDYEILNNTIDL